MAGQIFISYSKKDKDFAWKLADDLVHAGHKVWIDRSLQVGEDWEQTIEKQLAQADEVIVLLSMNAIASKWVQHEGSIAYGLKKRMYPVLIEKVSEEDLPIWMSKFQYHSFFNIEYETSFNALNAVLTPKNPVRDLLDQKHYDHETYQLLMDPKELEIVAAQLSNPSLVLNDADKRLLLYSAVAHGLGQPWIALAGEGGIPWLREAVQDGERPAVLRSGAAASLGAAGDRLAFEQLSRAAQEVNRAGLRDDSPNLLATFLLHSPAEFELPGRIRWDIFLRLARLRIREGASQRRRMKRVAMVAALACVVILYSAYFIYGDLVQLTSIVTSIISFFIFLLLGQLFAYAFAELLTSTELIVQRKPPAWRLLILSVLGTVSGAPLLIVINGSNLAWFAGSLIGFALGVWRAWPEPRRPFVHWLLSVAGAIAALAIVLSGPATSPLERVTAAINTTGFVLAYLLLRFHSKAS